ncbi:MAG: UV DNA damage repair endonuclease UvsE [Methanomicrobiales archaeon]|nr:UV DNA damage repair endonuclease UvsE [Methanomicrobiales archaeon]
MKIGYPCINRTIGCKGDRSFRLASYSDERLAATIKNNLDCLLTVLRWNVEHRIFFFRITSDLIPFASHPVCTFPWQERFASEFRSIGQFIRNYEVRISMHPDQFVLLNSPDHGVVERSLQELIYHSEVLNLLDLDRTAKFQLHVGGMYGDRERSIQRFVKMVSSLDEQILRHLVIENDEKLYSVADCFGVFEKTGLPILIDIFHHTCLNHGEDLQDLLTKVAYTWRREDGIPMADYSSQHPSKRTGSHAETLNEEGFRNFLVASYPHNMDLMLEIKDKERSALRAVELASLDTRFYDGRA